jgi:ATP-binding cassette, subfamily B (MDR/TAP), member 10
VSSGQISVGELTSLLMYTLYVGSGLQMLTYVHTMVLVNNRSHVHMFQIFLRKPVFLKVSTHVTGGSPDVYNARNWRWDAYF